MSKRFLHTYSVDHHRNSGKLGVISLREHTPEEEEILVAENLFEMHRHPDNMEEKFDPAIHTLDALAAGIPGHYPVICRECEDTDLPAEHLERRSGAPTFRDAWEDTGVVVQVNMPKARGIHMDRIRVVRDDELSKQDVEFVKALESGDTIKQTEIARLKQTLRDIPQTFDLTTPNDTPEELKALWPTDLYWPY